jgi:hypothetical protein
MAEAPRKTKEEGKARVNEDSYYPADDSALGAAAAAEFVGTA